MKRVTKIAAGVLLGIGLPITLMASARLIDPQTSPQERMEIQVALLILGLPPTAAGGWLIWGSSQRSQRENRDRLQSAFYRLLREGNGHLTVLRFAMETGLEGDAAKLFLDERAKEFNASFHVSEEGSISYRFDLGGTVSGTLTPSTAETYDVVLIESGASNRRRQVVKAVHELTDLEWGQAKAIVKRLPEPVTIQQGVSKAIAETCKQRLEAAGAEVLIILR